MTRLIRIIIIMMNGLALAAALFEGRGHDLHIIRDTLWSLFGKPKKE